MPQGYWKPPPPNSTSSRDAEIKDYPGLSRSRVYQLIDRGAIAASNFGGSLRVPRQDILDYEKRCPLRRPRRRFHPRLVLKRAASLPAGPQPSDEQIGGGEEQP